MHNLGVCFFWDVLVCASYSASLVEMEAKILHSHGVGCARGMFPLKVDSVCPVWGLLQQPANRTHNPQLHTIPTT
jgi:hypothetical protein